MYLEKPTATWPPGGPEIPKPWPGIPPRPGVPGPGGPQPGVSPAPQPILPSWLEPASISLERELADRLLAQRIILVDGRLDEALASHVTVQLLLLDAQGNDPVTMQLSSADADLEPALALAGAIDLISAPVHVVARGTVRGPAIGVLAAAKQREAQRHTLFVLSTPHFSGDGTADQLAVLADQHARQLARFRDLIARATGRSDDEIAADLEAGRVFSADEAKDYGLVSRLL